MPGRYKRQDYRVGEHRRRHRGTTGAPEGRNTGTGRLAVVASIPDCWAKGLEKAEDHWERRRGTARVEDGVQADWTARLIGGGCTVALGGRNHATVEHCPGRVPPPFSGLNWAGPR